MGNGEPSYALSISGYLRTRIRDLTDHAGNIGVGEAFKKSLTQVLYKLEKEPNKFGEPSHRMPNSQLMVRRGALAPVYVRFAVHEERRTVVLLNIQMLAFRL